MAFPSLTSGIFSAATGGVADEAAQAAQAAQAFRDSSTAVDQDSSALIAPPVDNTPLSWTQPGAIQPGAIQPWTPTPFAGEAYEPAPTPVWTPTGMTTTDPDNPYVPPEPPPPVPIQVVVPGTGAGTDPSKPPMAAMPSGFKAPTGAVTLALVPFFNPTTGETWIAPSGGYTPGPGWQLSSDQEFTPTTTPPTATRRPPPHPKGLRTGRPVRHRA